MNFSKVHTFSIGNFKSIDHYFFNQNLPPKILTETTDIENVFIIKYHEDEPLNKIE